VFLFNNFEYVCKRSGGDDCRAMLVIMEDRISSMLSRSLQYKSIPGFNVFQVDAAEGGAISFATMMTSSGRGCSLQYRIHPHLQTA